MIIKITVLDLFTVLTRSSLTAILEDLIPYSFLFDPIRFISWKRETEYVRLESRGTGVSY